ncbi:enoyl-CoA hydratase family protein [Williamsia sp. CHRR-6]|uniref:enoyl-CoA hydratase family protein n=1 Tax=Williamsia sp. CHRR-6 TaxID=2835871 RepID=UPI001BDA5D6B|nr:enoyl-CoA hydratase family protein [Williamsia sp. CHRR-6]MBT0565804.1 enoyl-CoA hydratase family protein [Williamsia sp. CHRR-6]
MTDELVHLDVAGTTATITLDSPSNRNALSTDLVSGLLGHLQTAAATASVRCVVLTHTGGTFCAGADLAGALKTGMSPDEASAAGAQGLVRLMRAMLELPIPVIGRVDGHVRAGGFGLLGACDMVVAGPSSTFALTEARLGLAPSVISLTLLSRMTSRAVSRYFVTGEKFGAQEAAAAGVITVAADSPPDLDARVAGWVSDLAAGSPQGLRESKRLATAAIREEFDRWADERAAHSAALFSSEEAREGMASFLQKRPPRWVSAP